MFFPDNAETSKNILSQTSEPTLPLTQWAFDHAKQITIPENWALNLARDKYRIEYHAVMKARGVDFLLTPTYPGVAAVLGEPQYWNYTAIWNILDQPGVVFPSGLTVDPSIDKAEDAYKTKNAVDEREWRKYRAERYEGAPVALQLVGKRYRDEETLVAGKVIEGLLRG